MRKLLMVATLGLMAGSAAGDEYFAYYVRTTLKRPELHKVGPERPQPGALTVLTEGPMTMAEGMERSREIMRSGACKVQEAALGSPGKATCYPPHSILQVEVFSPR